MSQHPAWGEEDSRFFIDMADVVVPYRAVQHQVIAGLIPPQQQPFHVLELCCGDGTLAGVILEAHPQSHVHGFDGSPVMLEAAGERLRDYGNRFDSRLFDLVASDWRHDLPWPLHAVVSSLAIHHLDGEQKATLYADVYRLLRPGGVFIIADLVQPAGPQAVAVAAQAWDNIVRRQVSALENQTAAFDYFQQEKWNIFRYPDPTDKPSPLFRQLTWLQAAGFTDVDVYWMVAGHAIFGGRKTGDAHERRES